MMDATGNKPLQDQVALVTGGGAGIGRATALALAEAGAHIVIAEKIPERCEETAARIRALGRDVLAPAVDVTDGEALRALVAQAGEQFGRLDILVNNAGGTANKAFLEQSERSWRRHIDLNLVSVLTATSAAVPIMIAGGRGGAIVNVSSIEGLRAAPGYAVYAACKAGLINLTRSLALEFADHGIRVNAIAPDYVDTPGLRGNITGPVATDAFPAPEAARRSAAQRIPLARAGAVEECASVALFLASPDSSYVTGAVLPVDGGTWASSGWLRDGAGGWTLGSGLDA